MELSPGGAALVALAALAAGIVNAVAGGGTLIVFPVLTLVGIPTVDAVVGTTIALVPGYLGGAYAQRADLADQRHRVVRIVPAAVVGGIAGAALLAVTSEGLFRAVVPWLIFSACALLAFQDRVRTWVLRRHPEGADGGTGPGRTQIGAIAAGGTFLGAVYGGYFGAGLGIILLAILGVLLDDSLRRVNALKQVVSFATNSSAAALLLFSGRVPWEAVALVAVGSLIGGSLGGRLVGHLPPRALRAGVVGVGLAVGMVYLVRSFTG